MPAFNAVLIANRGEIACRVSRTCRSMGIRSLLAAHPVDASSLAAKSVDEVFVLEGAEPIAAYLDGDQLIDMALKQGADAIHPGYGFLSENATFAAAVHDAGLAFIGPGPEAIRVMGDKIESRAFLADKGFSISQSVTEEEDPASFVERARALGSPLLIKASAGGGGKGMQIVRDLNDLEAGIRRAKAEGLRFFGDGRLYIEPYIERPRHIEVQVLADRRSNCIHLLDRECSIQRRFQKLIEEAPAPNLSVETRDAMRGEAVAIALAVGYESAGTVEFIVAEDGTFSFLEMNTRLQVEHPVTEAITGIDLVEQQILVAAGQELSISQDDVVAHGHAIEARVCAENPKQNFAPSTGAIRLMRVPEGEGLRLDSGVEEGSVVTTSFDPMLAKLVAHGADRATAVDQLETALQELVILGLTTNSEYLSRVLGHPAFRAADLHTAFITEHAEVLEQDADDDDILAAVATAALLYRPFLEAAAQVPPMYAAMGEWRN